MNGAQFSRFTNAAPATMTASTTATLMTTITELTLADSLIPTINSSVTSTAMSMAGRLMMPVT